MADIRDIMRDRLPNFEKYLGAVVSGQATEPLLVRHFQKGTFSLDVINKAGPALEFIIEGTDNKGQDKWFNLDPNEETFSISSDGSYAMTYAAEITWVRLRWISGTADPVKVSAFISKTIIGKR